MAAALGLANLWLEGAIGGRNTEELEPKLAEMREKDDERLARREIDHAVMGRP